MKLRSLVWAGVVGIPMAIMAQTTVSIAPDAASKEDVQKLFDVMASKEQMRQVMRQFFVQMQAINREQIKKRRPDVTEEELARLDRQSQNLIDNFPLDDMLNEMIPVYQKHFTKADVEGLTAFYSSPTGQKFLHEMPAVTGETMRAVFPKLQAQVEDAMKKAEQENSSPKK